MEKTFWGLEKLWKITGNLFLIMGYYKLCKEKKKKTGDGNWPIYIYLLIKRKIYCLKW